MHLYFEFGLKSHLESAEKVGNKWRISHHNTTNFRYRRGKSKDKGNFPTNVKDPTKKMATRKSPLYHNAQLEAPDGQPLCVCDTKKALWYVQKNLGELVAQDPLTVRLKFEPSGRPEVHDNFHNIYLLSLIVIFS